MTEPYCFDIGTLLNDRQPGSMLVAGKGADPAIHDYQQQKSLIGKECLIERIDASCSDSIPGRRYDMGIVTETLEHLGKKDAMLLLARLRDLYTRRFCASIRMGAEWPDLKSHWSRNELLGLGMTLVRAYEDEEGRPIHLYKYDIATYKPTPGWLNPDDWANPELWNKYRW